MEFKLSSKFKPTGDQPEAIRQLVEGVNRGDKYQILLGVTGSGKTFTTANVIEKLQRPTLILSHNKTLAAQLYAEFKEFFPENRVEYFVSYYDYYQPEAYMPVTGTYIEKDLSINDEIEKLRLSATSALLSGRRDIIVISSVSCLYGIGNPDDFHENIIRIERGQKIARNKLLRDLVSSLYSRNDLDFSRGNFRVKGDTVDLYLAYDETALRIIFWDDEIEELYSFDPANSEIIEELQDAVIFPANIFVTTQERTKQAVVEIQDDMVNQVEFFKQNGQKQEAKRLEDRVIYDLEMIKELGYCSGIENYSRYFDGRKPGSRPFCLLDYFPDDFVHIVDESHVTIPQIRAMYGGDNSRKRVLVEHGFRLPSAIDNRPLKFEEYESLIDQTIYLSATPADYELHKCEGVVVEQVVRPTGLLDPKIEVRPTLNQIDDLQTEIQGRIAKNERILVTTLTKRMAEELTDYLNKLSVKTAYIHSDVDTLDRVEIMEKLREGIFDVLVGVNLLREGLDLPEVSLVAILDADKEGFLRSERSLTQTAGRAARNVNGMVIMYADNITKSMQRTIEGTNHRRAKQIDYNEKNNITPSPVKKSASSIIEQVRGGSGNTNKKTQYSIPDEATFAAEPVVQYMSGEQLKKAIEKTKKEMQKASKELDFIEAARLRDEMYGLQKILNEKEKS